MAKKQWHIDTVFDPGTFGGSKASRTLVQMMNDGVIPVYEKHRVVAFIQKVQKCFNEVSSIKDETIRIHVLEVMYQDYVTKINKMNYPERFMTFFRNVISSIYKRKLLKGKK